MRASLPCSTRSGYITFQVVRYHWVRQVRHRRGVNPATVALANKNARRLWALMREPIPDQQAA
jgi:hypothetical protein